MKGVKNVDEVMGSNIGASAIVQAAPIAKKGKEEESGYSCGKNIGMYCKLDTQNFEVAQYVLRVSPVKQGQGFGFNLPRQTAVE